MAASATHEIKRYVLDTNVLIHDPHAPQRFDEHEVLIPMTVLEELDQLKSGRNDTARAARLASRTLSGLLDRSPMTDIDSGIAIDRGNGTLGTLRFLPSVELPDNAALAPGSADNAILQAAIEARADTPDQRVVVISKDVNLRVKAVALDIPVEDYRYDNALDDTEAMIDGVWSTDDLWATLERYELSANEANNQPRYRVVGDVTSGWHPGMLVHDDDGFEGIVRSRDGDSAVIERCLSYRNGRNLWGVNARDARQNFAINLLMDPDIDFVSLTGGAGTGKTFIAMAAALALVFEERRFERVLITRETMPMGEEIGFLPGTEEEKMSPWMRAFHDNIEELVRIQNPQIAASAKAFIDSRLELRSMSFMRGRTLSDTLLIVDEAQNLTPWQAKTLATRVGRNTKLICLGNVGQIDTPYLTAATTGLTHLVQRFRDWPHAGHVTLSRVERSRFADRAEQVL
jgi:PhoH-like ATPase